MFRLWLLALVLETILLGVFYAAAREVAVLATLTALIATAFMAAGEYERATRD